jgi:hypothetical protein
MEVVRRRWAAFDVLRLAVVAIATLTLNTCSSSQPTITPTPTSAAPTLVSPPDDAISPRRPTLTVNNVTASGTSTGTRTYDFQVADSQAALTSTTTAPAISATGVAEGANGQTSYVVDRDLQLASRFYWRARAVAGSTVGAWSSAFRFRTDFAVNNPPVIQSLTPSSPRVEVNTEVGLTAVVQDQETNPANLIYEWSASAGSFASAAASTRWRAPATSAPAAYTLTLTVIERYTVTDPDGVTSTRENRTVATAQVQVNDSPGEIAALATTFIDDFIHPDRSPEFCVRNFSDNCSGKADELSDIRFNRANFVIDPSRSSMGSGSIAFYDNGSASRRTVVPAAQAGFAVLLATCRFASTDLRTGVFGTVTGTCELTTVYENFRWYLCDSHYLNPSSAVVASGFRF